MSSNLIDLVRNRRRRRFVAAAAGAAAVAGALVAVPHAVSSAPQITERVSSFAADDGTLFTATNHLTGDARLGGKYLVVWAGDENAADHNGGSLQGAVRPAVNPVHVINQDVPDSSPGNDFLAIIDANPRSPGYGKVVNTVTLGPVPENEPHHLQYVWHQGDHIYAGGLFSDITYVLDVSALPELKLTGVNLPTDTPCGSVPDAYWVLRDGTAYGTYMGGPDVPGPCTYTNGEVRIGNGFAGTPGSLVHIGTDGKTLSEVPADTETPVDRDSTRCPGVPTTVASCANPHGIQVREDLNRMVTSDYAEPKNVPADPVKPIEARLFRDTVRIWDISDRNEPKVVSVSAMPDGPRHERNPGHEEPSGIMEATVTNLPSHKGAFASSMCGGVIYYTPDITDPHPVWREVFDDTAAAKRISSDLTEGAGCDGGGWVQTSRDDRFLYHAVIGRNPGALDAYDKGVPKMVYALDISKLVGAGRSTACNIDTIAEVWDGGAEADCPAVVGTLSLPDGTSGGPHWGALDNFTEVKSPTGVTWRDAGAERRIAVSNYFVARSGVDGNHKVCIVDVSPSGALSLDTSFRDEFHGTPCVDFNRTDWPHGATGNAKPHSQLFVVRKDLIAP